MISHKYEHARLRKIGALVQGRTVLDVGFAQGPNPYLQGRHRVGYDREVPAPGTCVYEEQFRGDVADIVTVLRGRSFDTIVCAEIIEHLERPYDFLRDLHGLLSTGGRLILTTPNPLGFPVVIAEFLRMRRFFYAKDHTYYFLPRWVVRMMEGAGYQVVNVSPIGLWLPWGFISWCPVALSYQVIYVATRGTSG
jgi:SAM-dependent methyltransferase